MFRFNAIIVLVIVLALFLTSCGVPATEFPVTEEEFVATEPPADVEVPAATEPPATDVTDEQSPLPSDTPEPISVPTEAPTSESVSACPTETSSASIVEITNPNLDAEVYQSPIPVLIQFWAAWHGPSKAISPAVEEIANEYADRLKVGRVDIDEYPEIGYQYGVETLPAFILISNGSEQARIIGDTSKEAICEMLNQQLP
jgi:thioredoxin 1